MVHFNGFNNSLTQYADHFAFPFISDHFDDDGDDSDGDDDDGNSFSHYNAILQMPNGVNDVSY